MEEDGEIDVGRCLECEEGGWGGGRGAASRSFCCFQSSAPTTSATTNDLSRWDRVVCGGKAVYKNICDEEEEHGSILQWFESTGSK